MKFDDSDKYIGASYSDGTVKVFNAYTGKLYHKFHNSYLGEGHDQIMPVNAFRFRPTPTSTS